MRFIFAFLLLSNVALLVGFLLDLDSDSSVVIEAAADSSQPSEYVAPIKLLSELELSASEDPQPALVAAPQALEQDVTEETTQEAAVVNVPEKVEQEVGVQASVEAGVCKMVGPFKVGEDAENFHQRLTALNVVANVKEFELSSGRGYWVYLPPLDSRGQARQRLNDLQSRGIDSYIIPRGRLVNGISLGMYNSKDVALRRKEEFDEQGLASQIEMIERTYKEIWVLLEAGEHEKIGDETWVNLIPKAANLELRQNFCDLDLAS